MSNAIYKVPIAVNEPILNYSPGSKERDELKKAIAEMRSKVADVPMFIGGKEIRTEKKGKLSPPHDHQHVLGNYSVGDASHVTMAIEAAMKAKQEWAAMEWEQLLQFFSKAAELLSGPYRAKINAATMLGQSKNVFQAEVDAACEMIDFFVSMSNMLMKFTTSSLYLQKVSGIVWSIARLKDLFLLLRHLILLPLVAIFQPPAAMCGNVVVWKPANTQIYSAKCLCGF